jgi:hypothetical protein
MEGKFKWHIDCWEQDRYENSNLQTLKLKWKPNNFGVANLSWKCIVGNKTNTIFQFANSKTMLETFQTLE